MIRGFTFLLLCQLAGEMTARGLGLPVPGPVVGLVLLVVLLVAAEKSGRLDPASLEKSHIGQVSGGLLANLTPLFVPAGVGLVQHTGLLGRYGLALGLTILVSTTFTIALTVGVFVLVKRLTGGDARDDAPERLP